MSLRDTMRFDLKSGEVKGSTNHGLRQSSIGMTHQFRVQFGNQHGIVVAWPAACLRMALPILLLKAIPNLTFLDVNGSGMFRVHP